LEVFTYDWDCYQHGHISSQRTKRRQDGATGSRKRSQVLEIRSSNNLDSN
jgi:hypothetical protein